jgi:hypothetical protein
MPSERSRILTLLEARHIDVGEAERLLILVGGQNRFLMLARFLILALWTIAIVIATPAHLPGFSLLHLVESLQAVLCSAFQSVTASEAFHYTHVFFIRLLGELP